jgi:hypothetical protein
VDADLVIIRSQKQVAAVHSAKLCLPAAAEPGKVPPAQMIPAHGLLAAVKHR